MMARKHQFAAAVLVAVAAGAFLGCGTSQVIGNLELAVDAVSVALPLIGPAAGLPADLQAQIQQYLAATNTAIGQASVILSSPASDAAKAAEIAAAFAGVAVPAVPAKYQGIASAVQQVAVLVSKFLAGLPVASTQPLAVRAHAAIVATPGKTTPFSISDQKRLLNIREKVLTQAR